VLDGVLRTAARPPGCRIVIVLDQLEGITASQAAGAQIDAFVRIMRALGDRSIPLFAVMVLRSDAFPAVASTVRMPPHSVHEVGLGPLDVADLARIIEEPARVDGIEIDAGLSAQMAADSGGVSALPLLSFAVRQMYDKGGKRRLLTADYEQLGGVRNAVIGQLAFLADPNVDQSELRALAKGFGALVMTTREGGFVRRTAAWSEFEPGAHRLLEELVARRILHRSASGGGDLVELAHESLITSWPTLAEWVAENGDLLKWRQSFQDIVNRWVAEDRPDDHLVTGRQLNDAAWWLDRRPEALREQDRSFISRSLEREHRERRRQEKLLRRTEALRRAAVAERLIAHPFGAETTAPLHLAIDSLELHPTTDGDRALRTVLGLTPDVVQLESDPQVRSMAIGPDGRFWVSGHAAGHCRLHGARDDALVAEFVHRPEPTDPAQTMVTTWTGIDRGPEPVPAVTWLGFSGLGTRLVAGCADGVVYMLGVPDMQPLWRATVDGGLTALSVDPTGSVVAVGTEDGHVVVLDAESGEVVRRVQHRAAVVDVAVAPDGSRLAALDGHGLLTLAATRGEEDVRSAGFRWSTPSGATQASVGFSSDGSSLAVAGYGCTVFELPAGTRLTTLLPDTAVSAVAFDPTGAKLAVVDWHRTTRVFDVRSGIELVANEAELMYVHGTAIAVSPDGRSVAVGYDSGHVHVYDAERGREQARVDLGGAGAKSIEFSPDGTSVYVLAGGRIHRMSREHGSTVEEFEFEQGVLSVASAPRATDPTFVVGARSGEAIFLRGDTMWWIRHKEAVRAVAADHLGRHLATAGDDGLCVVFDTVSEAIVVERRVSVSPAPGKYTPRDLPVVCGLSISADGCRLLVASRAGALEVLDLPNSSVAVRIVREEGIRGAGLSPSGRFLALAVPGSFEVFELGDSSDPTFRWRNEIRPDHLARIAFSADDRLVSWSEGFRTSVHAVCDGEIVFDGPGNVAPRCAFSPDGRKFALSVVDRTVRIHDTTTWAETARYQQDGDGWSLAFSPDGRLLAAGTDSRWTYVWDTGTNKEVCRLDPGYVWDVAFGPGGQTLLTGSSNGRASIFPVTARGLIELARKRAMREPDERERRQFWSAGSTIESDFE
jgi:WD40 repeat protein